MTTKIKKVRNAVTDNWQGNGFGYANQTARYAVTIDGVAVATIDGRGTYGYMEKPDWELRAVAYHIDNREEAYNGTLLFIAWQGRGFTKCRERALVLYN